MATEQTSTASMDKRLRRQAAREAREAEQARGARRKRFQRLASLGVAVLLIGGLVVGLGWWVLRPKPGTYVPSQGNAHVGSELVGFRYTSDPPTSGPHSGGSPAWGIYDQPIPRILQIHGLEEGAVLVQYNCTGCDDLVRKLKDIVLRYRDKAILAPYPGMKTRIALTAWSYIDAFDQLDEPRILRFIEAHRGIDHQGRYGGFGS